MRPEPDIAQRWDARYAAAGPDGPFGQAPNAYLRMCLGRSEIAPASALMLADGDGRNGRWLAGRGLAVTAVDISSEGTAQARARDAGAGVAVERLVADLAHWAPEPGPGWDLAGLFYLQGPRALRLSALALAADALARGGWLIAEGFATDQAPGAMGPTDPDKLYDLAEVTGVATAAGLELHEAMAGRVRLDEGACHQGLAQVIRLLARRG